MLTSDAIAALFTRDDRFLCARWGRAVAPVAFGLADDSLAVLRPALTAVFAHAGVPVADTDPDSGANLMIFAVRDWAELHGIPDLDRLTGLPDLAGRLAGHEEYRLFRFDADGAIRACLTFLNLGGPLGEAHPAALGERIGVNAALTFAAPVRPSEDIARLIRVAYAPVLPAAATDPAHALRLAARL